MPGYLEVVFRHIEQKKNKVTGPEKFILSAALRPQVALAPDRLRDRRAASNSDISPPRFVRRAMSQPTSRSRSHALVPKAPRDNSCGQRSPFLLSSGDDDRDHRTRAERTKAERLGRVDRCGRRWRA